VLRRFASRVPAFSIASNTLTQNGVTIMVRDCLSFSYPDAIFEKLDFEEEPHLVAEATKILKP
jgi:hypothetical protein